MISRAESEGCDDISYRVRNTTDIIVEFDNIVSWCRPHSET